MEPAFNTLNYRQDSPGETEVDRRFRTAEKPKLNQKSPDFLWEPGLLNTTD